jgi:hypothetical protein
MQHGCINTLPDGLGLNIPCGTVWPVSITVSIRDEWIGKKRPHATSG